MRWLALLFLLRWAGAEEEELIRPTRIVNGQSVAPGKAEWQVSIQTKFSDLHFCGGTLISPTWVLTAAHCTLDKTPNKIRVGVGSNSLSDMHYFYNVKKIVRHEYYSKKTLVNDIALLELYTDQKSFPGNVKAEFLSLEKDENFLSTHCYVTGFGRLVVNGPRPSEMKFAQVPLYTYAQCRGTFAANFLIGEGHVCAGGKSKDACQGDSGGPLACCTGDLSTSKSCKLVGVTSWGIGCGNPGIPGVYTKVAHYRDWIEAVINGQNYEDKEYSDKGGWNFFQQLNKFISAVIPFSDEEALEKDKEMREKYHYNYTDPNTTKYEMEKVYNTDPNTTQSGGEKVYNTDHNTTQSEVEKVYNTDPNTTHSEAKKS